MKTIKSILVTILLVFALTFSFTSCEKYEDPCNHETFDQAATSITFENRLIYNNAEYVTAFNAALESGDTEEASRLQAENGLAFQANIYMIDSLLQVYVDNQCPECQEYLNSINKDYETLSQYIIPKYNYTK